MSFVLTEDQDMLRETAMAFVQGELAVSHLRALRDKGANGDDGATRKKLAELGFFGVIIPDEPGGETFGLVGLGQILEAQGRTLALATFGGATALALQSDDPPSVLRERVTSKGGTTHAALTSLEADGVKAAFIKAMRAAQRRANELGNAP